MWSPSPDSTPSDTNKPQSLLSVPWSHLVKITCHMSRKEKKNCCHRTVVLCRVSAKRTPNHLKSNISLPCTLVVSRGSSFASNRNSLGLPSAGTVGSRNTQSQVQQPTLPDDKPRISQGTQQEELKNLLPRGLLLLASAPRDLPL